MTGSNLARLIDHTALKPETTSSDIERLCSEAVQYDFATLCVMPWWVSLGKQLLSDMGTPQYPVCTVIGFPIGAHRTEVKKFEAERSLEDGATEIDLMMNVGAFLSSDTRGVAGEIESLARLIHSSGGCLKVIIETALLRKEQIVDACRIVSESGGDFVKTSSGFSSGGATEEDVRLMRASVPGGVGVKASGRIRTAADAIALVQAGASRIGTSNSVAIIESL
jgi:deoxyribose-phosphate aldolase